ncbi:aspartate aminotransferase [Desulfonatronum thiosulfatophilum]|uniref:Aspartate aminotransferase n=1 Tax=Desulfonatronum thiosulfatophilum TaxID=617002 RepID=A0A1G6B9J0_9BACT|nr:alanine--glyoxylate aminotransferase family protein [Desulfonatronum thiosulfatophilum]SDB17219.1 aspartate aminotransferase [Desulfonatronum thiosulfatophilum]
MRNKLRLLTPGPTPLPEEVRLALAQDMVHHRKAGFKEVLHRVQEGLQWLFGTRQPVLPLTCSGSGAMNAALWNLFAPGERVLVVDAGKFGQRWGDIAQSRGLEITAIRLPWGVAVSPAQIQEALDNDPSIRGVLVQASETSTGVLHPIREIAEITKVRETLLVVDGISAVAISPCPMDDWGVDCLLTGSQKGLMLPPGLAFIALSPRAWNEVERHPCAVAYFDLLRERENCGKNQTLFTPAINLLNGLDVSLHLFRKQGLEEIFRKQWALTCMTRAGVQALGLDLMVKENYTWGLTSILLPQGMDGQRLLEIAARDYGVVMAGGQDHLKGRIVRLGHMGHVDFADILAGIYALRQSFKACGGHSGSRDYLEISLAAYQQALDHKT